MEYELARKTSRLTLTEPLQPWCIEANELDWCAAGQIEDSGIQGRGLMVILLSGNNEWRAGFFGLCLKTVETSVSWQQR